MKRVFIKSLSLAAFLLYKGCKLISVDRQMYEFESSLSRKEWEIEFANSEFFKYDQSVLKIRYLQTEQKEHDPCSKI